MKSKNGVSLELECLSKSKKKKLKGSLLLKNKVILNVKNKQIIISWKYTCSGFDANSDIKGYFNIFGLIWKYQQDDMWFDPNSSN